jgi:hypothetical protein
MLTSELAIAEYDFVESRVHPDRLTRQRHSQYLGYARRMLRVYRTGVGRTRRDLHRGVHHVFSTEADCPTRRIDAFCKLLDDASAYERDRRGQAAQLRQKVFHLAAARHPLVRRADRLFESTEDTVKAEIARQLGKSWDEIDSELFADVMEFHRLKEFSGYASAEELLARYNVAQVQVALFRAVRMTVWAAEDFKSILRYAKLARLMHTITRQADGKYCLRFDGAASALRDTRRYGVAMARFLPGLLSCRNWRMHATVQARRAGWQLSLDLSPQDGLRGQVQPPAEFDSNVEESFVSKWGDERRDGWRLVREGEILHQGQKVFVPDFVFRHEDGRTVLMEIVGFWTPEYLRTKVETLRTFGDAQILLAVAHSTKDQLNEIAQDAIVFKTSLHIKDVLERLEAASHK